MTGRRLGVLGMLAVIAVACGDPAATGTSTVTPDLLAAIVPVPDRVAAAADPTLAGKAISDFGLALFSATRATSTVPGNLTVSPASVAFALAMLEPGAVGTAQTQLRDLLHIEDPIAFHASMNALQQNLEARAPTEVGSTDNPGELKVRIANAAYLQKGYPFEPAYLESIGSNYGPVLNEVDFGADPNAVAHQINAFVAEATNGLIPHLVPDGAIDPLTVLALVNALYLQASWFGKFDEAATAEQSFTHLDGTTRTVDMMHGGSDSSAQGDGWVGATKGFTGGLVAQFILPDEGRFDEVAGDIGSVFEDAITSATSGATLDLPRFDVRFNAGLNTALNSLGLTAPHETGGLLGIANDPNIILGSVIHETDVVMDESGVEAAAATVAFAIAVSAPINPPVPVTLDRPFLYRIFDTDTGATLFIGQVLDPVE